MFGYTVFRYLSLYSSPFIHWFICIKPPNMGLDCPAHYHNFKSLLFSKVTILLFPFFFYNHGITSFLQFPWVFWFTIKLLFFLLQKHNTFIFKLLFQIEKKDILSEQLIYCQQTFQSRVPVQYGIWNHWSICPLFIVPIQKNPFHLIFCHCFVSANSHIWKTVLAYSNYTESAWEKLVFFENPI